MTVWVPFDLCSSYIVHSVNLNIFLGQGWVTILLAVEEAFYLVFSPIFGIISDYTTARRMPYLVGLILLATSMALQTASHSVGKYVAGRALQGASATAV